MKARVQVLAVTRKQGVSKTGNAYDMSICQCVVHGEQIVVGELVLPKGHATVEPGFYQAEFGIAINSQDKRISGQLVQLVPEVAAVRTSTAAKPAAVV